MSERPEAYDNLIKQIKQYNITDDDVIIKNRKINENYKSIYRDLLPDEGKEVECKKAINIGNKDVHALSDIEGHNIDFLDFLKRLGLVEYQTNEPADLNGWKSCWSLKKDKGSEEFPVYYKFNKKACGNFQDVIVLCGDYVRNSRNVSEGTVKILEELRSLLNFDKQGVGCGTEDKKKLFLLAGNHDIADYAPEIRSGDTQHDLKAKVLKLGLYPQLMLVNGDGKKLLFQHTNFPYREERNYIVNKKIDPNKAIELLNDNNACNKPILLGDGFFNLRYIMPEGAQQPQYQDINGKKQLKREVYSDFGKGYDAKFVGHDSKFQGISYRQGHGGNIYNVNIGNRNNPNYLVYRSNKKMKIIQQEQLINCAAAIAKYCVQSYLQNMNSQDIHFDENIIKQIEKQVTFNLYSMLQNNNIHH